ncbi:MAG: biopolymer transporter ExbD [Terriglobales bacterium]
MGFSTAGGGPSSTGPKMNVTPLIDVLLVLIIVFMLVVVEQRPTGLEAQIPQPPNPKDHSIPPPQATIVIQIHRAKAEADRSQAEHPQVMVNEEAVEWDRLRDRLRDIFAIRVERIAYVEADDDIDFQDVADVIAIARLAGVDRVGLLTEDGKHGPMAGRHGLVVSLDWKDSYENI